MVISIGWESATQTSNKSYGHIYKTKYCLFFFWKNHKKPDEETYNFKPIVKKLFFKKR
jgi:hypothetical protein